MIKRNLKTLAITGVIIMLPFIYGLIAYPFLPAQIPIHLDFNNNIGWYCHKLLVLIMSLAPLIIQWITIIEAYTQNKGETVVDGNIKTSSWICAAISIVSGLVLYGGIILGI